MKKIYFLIYFLLSCTYICIAQKGNGQALEAIKVAYITRELNLSPEEAQRFWPVYNNYTSEVKLARQTYPNDEIAFEEVLVNIRKKYKDNFKRILVNDNRVNRVFIIERQYRELLRKTLDDRSRGKRYP